MAALGPDVLVNTMQREELIGRLRGIEPALRGFGVGSLYVFGSHARDEAVSGSDVDVFVDPAPGADFGFVPFMDAYEAITAAVGSTVDYGTRKSLHPLLRAEIEREALRVF